MATADPIRDKKQLCRMAKHWLHRGNTRNHALIIMGAYTALRIVDLLGLRWDEVYDSEQEKFYSHVRLIEKKTGKRKTIALNPQAITALQLCLPEREGEFIFGNNRKTKRPISRVQAWRIIRATAYAVNAAGQISCHSLRKTFGYFAWREGVQPVMLMDIFNHTSFEVTRRYLGISQDDRDRVYLSIVLD